jgi:hypothetical protein
VIGITVRIPVTIGLKPPILIVRVIPDIGMTGPMRLEDGSSMNGLVTRDVDGGAVAYREPEPGA